MAETISTDTVRRFLAIGIGAFAVLCAFVIASIIA